MSNLLPEFFLTLIFKVTICYNAKNVSFAFDSHFYRAILILEVQIFFTVTMSHVSILCTGIYYCQSGDEYGHFEKFCEKFLPGILIKEIESGQSSPQRLALVLFPSSANRQDPTNSLKQLLTDALFNYQISGECNIKSIIYLILIKTNEIKLIDC